MGTSEGSWSWFRTVYKVSRGAPPICRRDGDNLTSRTEVENGKVRKRKRGKKVIGKRLEKKVSMDEWNDTGDEWQREDEAETGASLAIRGTW